MPFLLVLLGTGAVAWLLKETDYIIPVTGAMVLFLIVMAVNPGVALFMLMAMAALIVLSIIVAFLPQVLGFLLGALILVVCIIMAGAASANEQRMDRDTCGEIISDVAEMNYYAEGWKDVRPSEWGKDIRIILYKKDKEVEMTCSGGMMRMEERPHQVQLQIEIKTGK